MMWFTQCQKAVKWSQDLNSGSVPSELSFLTTWPYCVWAQTLEAVDGFFGLPRVLTWTLSTQIGRQQSRTSSGLCWQEFSSLSNCVHPCGLWAATPEPVALKEVASCKVFYDSISTFHFILVVGGPQQREMRFGLGEMLLMVRWLKNALTVSRPQGEEG